MRKIPVLQVSYPGTSRPDLFIRQSTSILRFAALTSKVSFRIICVCWWGYKVFSKDVKLPEGIDWYPENIEERIKSVLSDFSLDNKLINVSLFL